MKTDDEEIEALAKVIGLAAVASTASAYFKPETRPGAAIKIADAVPAEMLLGLGFVGVALNFRRDHFTCN